MSDPAVGASGPPDEAPTAPSLGLGSSRLLFLLLALALLGAGLSFWRPVPAGVWHDDGVYMLIGRAVAHGDGLHYAGVPGSPPAVKFPPLYPSLLAVLWWVLGSVGAVTLAAELLNLLFLAGAGALLGWALYRGAGMDRRTAMGLAGLAFVSADVWRWALVPLSEPLFILLAAGALATWGAVRSPGDRKGAATLATLLLTLVLTRTAGVALVAGFAVALLMVRGWKVALAVAAPAAVGAVGWAIWASGQAALVPEGMRDVLGPYGGWLSGQVLGSPGAFAAELPAHAAEVGGRIFALLVPGLSGPLLWAAGVPIVALAAVGLVRLVRTFPPLPWILLAYLAMILVWPFVDRRLVAPLHPWMVVAVGVGVEGVYRWVRRPRVREGVAAVVFLWVAAYAAVTAGRASREWAVGGYQLRARRMATAVEALQRTAPDTAVVGAPEFWAALSLHGGWMAAPSARFTPRSEDEDRPVWGTPAEQVSLWWDAGIDYLVLEQGGAIHGAALDRLDDRCPEVVQVLAEMPPQILVRLNWSDACRSALELPARGS